MKKRTQFEWLGNQELMIVQVKINGEVEMRMALDTGATQTTIDLNMLLMEGISLRESVGQQAVETANGVVMADIFLLSELHFAGLTLHNFPVQVIDFIAHSVFSNYGGYLGLDVLAQKDFCIHFEDCSLTFG